MSTKKLFDYLCCRSVPGNDPPPPDRQQLGKPIVKDPSKHAQRAPGDGEEASSSLRIASPASPALRMAPENNNNARRGSNLEDKLSEDTKQAQEQPPAEPIRDNESAAEVPSPKEEEQDQSEAMLARPDEEPKNNHLLSHQRGINPAGGAQPHPSGEELLNLEAGAVGLLPEVHHEEVKLEEVGGADQGGLPATQNQSDSSFTGDDDDVGEGDRTVELPMSYPVPGTSLPQQMIFIETEIDRKDIVDADSQSQQTPFLCPICSMYFNHILVTSCCGHYTCHSCVEMLKEAEQRFGANIRRGCQFYCDNPNRPVMYTDVEQDNKIKRYNDLDATHFSIRRKTSKRLPPGFNLDKSIPLMDLDKFLDYHNLSARMQAEQNPAGEPNMTVILQPVQEEDEPNRSFNLLGLVDDEPSCELNSREENRAPELPQADKFGLELKFNCQEVLPEEKPSVLQAYLGDLIDLGPPQPPQLPQPLQPPQPPQAYQPLPSPLRPPMPPASFNSVPHVQREESKQAEEMKLDEDSESNTDRNDYLSQAQLPNRGFDNLDASQITSRVQQDAKMGRPTVFSAISGATRIVQRKGRGGFEEEDGPNDALNMTHMSNLIGNEKLHQIRKFHVVSRLLNQSIQNQRELVRHRQATQAVPARARNLEEEKGDGPLDQTASVVRARDLPAQSARIQQEERLNTEDQLMARIENVHIQEGLQESPRESSRRASDVRLEFNIICNRSRELIPGTNRTDLIQDTSFSQTGPVRMERPASAGSGSSTDEAEIELSQRGGPPVNGPSPLHVQEPVRENQQQAFAQRRDFLNQDIDMQQEARKTKVRRDTAVAARPRAPTKKMMGPSQALPAAVILEQSAPRRTTISRRVRPTPVKLRQVNLPPGDASLAESQEVLSRVFKRIGLHELIVPGGGGMQRLNVARRPYLRSVFF